jgi:hypothetical protein
MPIRHRLFVIGSPRSGTTLLKSLLGQHESLYPFPKESQLFAKTLYPWFYIRRDRVMPHALVLLADNQVERHEIETHHRCLLRLDGQCPAGKTPLAAAIIHLLDSVALNKGKAGWIEKTPRHLYFCPLISKASPDAHFVHITRRGEDVVASYLYRVSAWGESGGIRLNSSLLAALRWDIDALATLKYRRVPHHHFATYGALVRWTEAELARILDECGLESDGKLTAKFGQPITMRSRFYTKLTPLQRVLVKYMISSMLYRRLERIGRCRYQK